jgi:hypothetical protein
VKKYSSSLVIRKMQIKPRIRYPYTPTEMTSIKKDYYKHQFWRGCGTSRTLVSFWWEGELVQSLWEVSWQFCIKLGKYLGTIYLPKRNESICTHKGLYANGPSNYICNCQNWKEFTSICSEQIIQLWLYSCKAIPKS